MRHTRIIVIALLAAIVPAAGARAAGPPANPPGMKRLSDERTLSRWAYPNNHARVRSRPTGQAWSGDECSGSSGRDAPAASVPRRMPA